MSLRPTLVREMSLAAHSHPNGLPHVSACSGLIEFAGRWFAVSDDEQHLVAFDLDQHSAARLIRLFDGALSPDVEIRKSQKPDLEVLTTVSANSNFPLGALLALGSGSKRIVRERGVCIPFTPDSQLGTPQHFDLAPLYARLRAHFADLNVEGAMFAGEVFRLLLRGNASNTPSACVSFSAGEIVDWIAGKTSMIPTHQNLQVIDLGFVDGVPLTITDAASVAGHAELWVVSAAAENTANSYADGPCVGSAVAFLDARCQVVAIHTLSDAPKVEGIVARLSTHAPGSVTLMMVTDADDPQRASQVLRVEVALPK